MHAFALTQSMKQMSGRPIHIHVHRQTGRADRHVGMLTKEKISTAGLMIDGIYRHA